MYGVGGYDGTNYSASQTLQTVVNNTIANLGIDAFDTTKAYAIGDVVMYNYRMYRFTAAHAAGAWLGTDAEVWSIKKMIENKSGFENIIRDYNEVTSLASLPTDKYYIKATLASAPSSISFNSSSLPADGSEYTISIYNSSSTAYTFLLPSTGGWQSDATTISIPAGKVTELSVRCYEYNSSMFYVIKS